jgi:hypothetical protein
MTTLLLLLAAVAIPLVVLLPMLAGDHSRETAGRGWRFVKAIGSVIGVLLGATLIIYAVQVPGTFGPSAMRWSGMAISAFLLSQGLATAVIFIPQRRNGRPRTATSHTIRAIGYIVVTLTLFIASFTETAWMLLFAGFSGWLAAAYLYMSHKLRSREEVTRDSDPPHDARWIT